jgi:hypothetical protein
MSPLLEALQAAVKAGFDAPACKDRWCRGGRQHWLDREQTICRTCEGTGLDASDPYGLIGRALVRLRQTGTHVLLPWDTGEVETVWLHAGSNDPWHSHDREAKPEDSEPHDGTPTGLATALLRLVARVGTPQKAP